MEIDQDEDKSSVKKANPQYASENLDEVKKMQKAKTIVTS
jgi:hypothetical protein